MGARGVPAFIGGILCVAIGGSAGETTEGGANVASATVAAVAVSGTPGFGGAVEPWIHPSMTDRVRTKLETGFEIAVERVRTVPACADLFAELGANPIETLKTGLYLPVDSYRREIEACRRDVARNSRIGDNLAYTKAGGAPTWICRHFSTVSDEDAAVTVIHEALHHAGLNESPVDRTAMSSIEITRMVEAACGF